MKGKKMFNFEKLTKDELIKFLREEGFPEPNKVEFGKGKIIFEEDLVPSYFELNGIYSSNFQYLNNLYSNSRIIYIKEENFLNTNYKEESSYSCAA